MSYGPEIIAAGLKQAWKKGSKICKGGLQKKECAQCYGFVGIQGIDKTKKLRNVKRKNKTSELEKNQPEKTDGQRGV